ncbi:hypothetical protein Tco_0702973 [Tanacetum coccineum]|uniref:Integrase catalytic domain-containing protein n=1 Tax=Tanacetum coccineum TaxID=301880 RepID=A0ABQ4XYV2_9ASTR
MEFRITTYLTAEQFYALWNRPLSCCDSRDRRAPWALQQSGSQIKYEDITQINDDDIEEMDIKWNMALLSMRVDRFWKKTGLPLIRIEINPRGKPEYHYESLYHCQEHVMRKVAQANNEILSLINSAHSQCKTGPFEEKPGNKEKRICALARLDWETLSKSQDEGFNLMSIYVDMHKPLDNIDDKGFFGIIGYGVIWIGGGKSFCSSDNKNWILRNFITEIENLKDLKVKIIRCDNGGEFRNKEMDDFCYRKDGLNWLFDIESLTKSMNYIPLVGAGTSSSNISGSNLISSLQMMLQMKTWWKFIIDSPQKEQEDVHTDKDVSEQVKHEVNKEVPESSGITFPTTSSKESSKLPSIPTVETAVPIVSTHVLTNSENIFTIDPSGGCGAAVDELMTMMVMTAAGVAW